MDPLEPPASGPGRRFDTLHVVLLVLLAAIITAVAVFWFVRVYVYPAAFDPVTLSAAEQRALERKLTRFDSLAPGRSGLDVSESRPASEARATPEPYSEAGARREVRFTERELNALVANNSDLARRLALDLADRLVSASLLVPLAEDFPLLGGRTLKVRAGLELDYRDGRPVVVLKGVSVMGVPLPSAWLGGLKNVDLVREFGGDPGFWRAFADGVESIEVREGRLTVRLKE